MGEKEEVTPADPRPKAMLTDELTSSGHLTGYREGRGRVLKAPPEPLNGLGSTPSESARCPNVFSIWLRCHVAHVVPLLPLAVTYGRERRSGSLPGRRGIYSPPSAVSRRPSRCASRPKLTVAYVPRSLASLLSPQS